jgi:hypothetical protein
MHMAAVCSSLGLPLSVSSIPPRHPRRIRTIAERHATERDQDQPTSPHNSGDGILRLMDVMPFYLRSLFSRM